MGNSYPQRIQDHDTGALGLPAEKRGRFPHDDVIKWKHSPRHWPFVRGIHRSPVNSPHKGQWRGALTFILISARINVWVNRDDVIKWKHFPPHWPFVRGIHRSPVNSPHKGQWRGVLMFTLICARINGWVNNHGAGDLRRHRAHYYIIIMHTKFPITFRGKTISRQPYLHNKL